MADDKAARLEDLLKRLDASDSFALFEHLHKQGTPAEVVALYGELAGHAYSARKSPRLMNWIGRAGIQYAYACAAAANDKDSAPDFLSKAKTLAYDVAANDWPGWKDAGIAITPDDLAHGRDLAALNLRLAKELNKGDTPLSRALWLVGAHQLAIKQHDAALKNFGEAAEAARRGKEPGEGAMNDAYAALARVAASPKDAAARKDFDAALEKLKPVKDGQFYIGQVKTAAEVFVP